MLRFLPWLLLLTTLPSGASAQDMMVRKVWSGLDDFKDKPIWVAAAKCAAFEDTFEEAIALRRQTLAENRRKYPAHADSYRDDPQWEQRVRARVEPNRAYWRRYGLARLRRDRPGEDIEALFDAQVARELTDLRGTTRTEQQREDFDKNCHEVLLITGGSVSRVERGVADAILRADIAAAQALEARRYP